MLKHISRTAGNNFKLFTCDPHNKNDDTKTSSDK